MVDRLTGSLVWLINWLANCISGWYTNRLTVDCLTDGNYMYVEYCLKVSWQSLALRLNSWFFKLFEDGVSRLDDWGSSFKFRVEKYYELVLYNYYTFYSKNYLSVHWVRPVCFRVKEARALKAKCHLGIHLRKIHIIAVKIEPPFKSQQERS